MKIPQHKIKSTINCIFALMAIGILQGCIAYDNAVLYKKGYDPGKSNALKFNGFYQAKNKTDLFPVFFYDNGSVIFSGFSKDTIELKEAILSNPKGFWGYWGNYKISGDTITIETFPPNMRESRQERYLRKGIVEKGSITFYQQINRENKASEINEPMVFRKFDTKPDATANWIRTKKKYNK